MDNSYHSFLEEVTEDLFQQYTVADITRSIFILPGQKAVERFQQVLCNKIDNPAWLPQVLTLEPWIEQCSKITIAPNLDLLVLLYQTFQQFKAADEPFERFYGWGNMLLQDFDILDKCLVDPNQLFANLYEQKAITLTYEHLSEAQKEAIQSFWKSFEKRLSTQQQDFLKLWEILPHIYKRFTAELIKKGIGYAGLCYRELYNNLTKELLINYKHFFFIGFNALHPVEEKIFAWLHSNISTQFYWDTDAYYMNDKNQEAGYYLRHHQTKPYFQTSFKKPFPARIQNNFKKINFFEANTAAEQVELVSSQLQQLINQEGNSFQPHQAVIVLANEDLFLPMLHALPTNLQSVNTTLGYPITYTASYQLIEQILALQITTQQPTCPAGYFPTQAIIALLKHTPIKYCNQALASETIQLLTNHYTSYTSQKILSEASELYQAIFRPASSTIDIAQYVIDVMTLVKAQLEAQEDSSLALEEEALGELIKQLSYIQVIITPLYKVSIERFIQLFRQLIRSLQLTFKEKTSAKGIQILRIWETANLDFKYVFIVGMNEGNLPASTAQGSFIPYNLRKGYGLPTMDIFQATLDAYYFYRLLQRAQQVYITYNTPSSATNPKEVSRYLWQLLYESKLPIEQHYINTAIYTPTICPIIIKKDDGVLLKLEEFVVKNGQEKRSLTPAALNTYLGCSLRFYFRYILQLQVPQQLLIEDTDAIRFGSLFHKVMEKLYAPLQIARKGSMVQKNDLEKLKSQLQAIIAEVFSNALYSNHILQWGGEHLIEQEVMQKVVNKILEIDKKHTPFTLVGIEVGKQQSLMIHFRLTSDKVVALSGIIDRIDQKQDSIRVIDYKTGGDEKYVEQISNLFDRSTAQKTKVIFQTFFYAWLFKKHANNSAYKIMPGIVNTRSAFNTNFDPRLMVKQVDTKDYRYIEDITPYQSEFETGLELLLQEILDPQIPFIQTEDHFQCATCPYKRICER
ncbi:hypothetical protein Aasi_0460 [Candidatus Amoebophilus asiaticus 5a2]|uniref:PD-(D/E)XK endonuclease-like domain-containing protein n=1 Tax=Amoebophilus asiaticus (strain 5a2) TaxID=452471 RepID=B3ERL2_AMOA5|nr:PD-(D/E)XK nuclease family protein [Candidatus Amoebophilus asiaticus]ACE05864.1 hypothetical protein Aasi_0454 [Candidatus Amoebophilus asiaticus 5a2]ACE05870.1 hypothetical protein Aasi_0460 [Candidatus Amoebophilus asiaticus 5a2]